MSAASRQFSARPPSESRGITPSINYNRPITQHGVEGMPQTANPRKRLHYDKRYYMASVQSHMNKIREEIADLKSKTNRQKPTSAALGSDREAAKEGARIYETCQKELGVLNIALEMHLSKIGAEDTVAETAEVNKKNSAMLEELDRLYQQRNRCEESKKKILEDIKLEEQKVQEQLNKLNEEEIEEYKKLSSENQIKLKEISGKQLEMKSAKDSLTKFKEIFSYDSGRSEKVRLLSELSSKSEHRKNLSGHLEAVPVEQEREQLLVQVKNDKTDIDAFLKMKQNLEEQLEEKKNQLNGIEQELDSKNSQRLKKYRDVHTRHAQVNAYIESYQEVTSSILSNIAEKESIIMKALDYLLQKSPDDNFDELTELQTTSNPKDDYKLVVSRLSKLRDLHQKFEAERKSLLDKQSSMKSDMQTFKQVDKKLSELSEQNKQAEEMHKSLKGVLKVTTSAVEDAKKRLAELERALEKNDTYHEFVTLGKELEQLENVNEMLGDEIKTETSSRVMEEVEQEVKELFEKRNFVLIEKLNKKNGIN